MRPHGRVLAACPWTLAASRPGPLARPKGFFGPVALEIPRWRCKSDSLRAAAGMAAGGMAGVAAGLEGDGIAEREGTESAVPILAPVSPRRGVCTPRFMSGETVHQVLRAKGLRLIPISAPRSPLGTRRRRLSSTRVIGTDSGLPQVRQPRAARRHPRRSSFPDPS